ncbi:unnamed protein product, partial [Anisakis simplex]|uniref:mannosyl-oligosaccharide 1,3-1,6-alpha-mannosidase n=1 Tax=Anisakis simplex TaxID=6269 RepID=A0A0M3J0N4_ANISI
MLEEQFTKLSDLYETNNIIAVWGDDFRYNAIEEWFGTFTDYFESLERWYTDHSREPPTLSGDFFPYQCALGDMWTGYYTTRPFYKRKERELHAMIRSADLLSANAMKLMSASERIWIQQNLQSARRNLSLFQHHDAITGTSKKHVMSNYAQILFTAMHTASKCLQRSMQAIYKELFQMNEIPLQYNETTSKLPILLDPHKKISVAIFNSIERKRVEIIELILSTPSVSVTLNGRAVEAQIEPHIDPVTNALSTYYKVPFASQFYLLVSCSLFSTLCLLSLIGCESDQLREILCRMKRNLSFNLLVFRVLLPPLSTEIFVISYDHQSTQHTHIADILFVSNENANTSEFEKSLLVIIADHFQKLRNFNITRIKPDEFLIETESVKTTHSADSGLITSLPLIDLRRFIVKGPVQQSAYILSKYITQKIALHNIEGNEGEQLHISMRVDIRGFNNMELITRFSSDLHSNSTQFYTDSNGFQLLKREYNHNLPVNANYYPMPTAAVLQDDSRRITIVSDVGH